MCQRCNDYEVMKLNPLAWELHKRDVTKWREKNRAYWKGYYKKNREKLLEYSKNYKLKAERRSKNGRN